MSKKRRLKVQPLELAKRWDISVNVADNTKKATTQHFIRSAVHQIERRFKTEISDLSYNRLHSTFFD